MSLSETTYVLVPGAWQGAWAWTPVARRMRAAGARVVTITLPGLGDGDPRLGLRLSDAIDHLVGAVADLGPVTLVGHSWGGYVVTGAAGRLGRDRVSEVVYFNAVVPERGTGMVDENPLYADLIRAGIAASPEHTVEILREQVPMLMADAPKEMQDLFFDLLAPQPGGYMTDPLDSPNVAEMGIPARYLLGAEDQSLARPGAEFAARIGLRPIMLSGGHQSMLTRPDEVAAALLKS
jgi:pimeloyl-ACP methyl ester carboxylesterase